MELDALSSDGKHQLMPRMDPACASVVAALEDDPFYRAICAPYAGDVVQRRALLAQYFAYSIQEGRDSGRCVHLPDPNQGVAVWLLPQDSAVLSRAARNKRSFLEHTLSREGCENYYRMVSFMSRKAASVVDPQAWYLSIIAVAPAVQGQGFGRQLLQPTLAEVDRASATCYLESFSPRNLTFYERFGFVARARFAEPTAGADYAVMVRSPQHQ